MDFRVVYKMVDYQNVSVVTSGLVLVLVSYLAWSVFQFVTSWIAMYRKKPPGPFGLPIVGCLPFLGSEPHKTLWEMRKKYGDMIGLRMGSKYTVILNEYSVMREVLCHPAAMDRAPNLFDHIPEIGFITKNGGEWQEQRRFCLSATRDLGLGRGHWEDLIMEEVSSFVSELSATGGRPVDISHSLGSSISSNIISLLIGRRLEKEREAEKVQLSVDYSEVSFTFMGPSNPTSLVPGLRRVCEVLGIAGYDRVARIVKKFQSFVREEVSRHKTAPEYQDVRDFINIYLGKLKKLISSQNVQHYFSDAMLEGNLKILFLASSDTIMSSLGWALRLMALHRQVQVKVRLELQEVLGKEGRARYEERKDIPYTFAVLMEVERFASIVPLSTTRRASQDFEVRGCTIPKGSEIAANLWALHHDPAYWDRPEEFRPERFLSRDGSKLAKVPPSYAPFSIGRRNCPGETIAWMEILSYFSEIIRKFQVSTAPGIEPAFKEVNGLVAHLEPQPLCFTPHS